MERTAVLLTALLVLAIPAIVAAQELTDNNIVNTELTDDTGLAGTEDVEISSSVTTPVISALGVMGKGIAVSPGDPMDFMIAKIGIGAVKLTIDNKVKRVAIGVLILDDEKYRLKGVSVRDGQATGDIYKDGENVGSLDMASVEKGDIVVWAGTMELDGSTYHIYIMEGVRKIRAPELRDKVADYCRNNPDDTNCLNKVEDYCGNHPNDARCKAIFRKYCIAGKNMDDMRCREYVKDYCSENPNLSECVTMGIERANVFCVKNPDSSLCRKIDNRLVEFCGNNPDNEGCIRAKEIVMNRSQVLNRIRQYVTREISDLMPVDAVAVPVLTNIDVVSPEGG